MLRLAVAFLASLVACVPSPTEEVGASASPIINGTRERGYDEVVAVIRTSGAGGLCTGTVIGPRTVLTAKHCVYDGSTLVPAASFQILVTDRIDRGASYAVTRVLTTPGPFSDADLTEGRDIALLNTRSVLPVTPRQVARSTARRGMPIEIVGFGRTDPRSGNAGVKYRGQTNVGEIYRGVFQTEGMARTCQGDSGGPAFDAVGRVLGVTSFGVDERCREDMSFYTEVAAHLGLIEMALGGEAPCTRRSNRCNLADDDCDGVVDRGCGNLGDPCVDNAECDSGECRLVDGEFVCAQRCNPELGSSECPGGTVCEYQTCGIGLCLPGTPGSGAPGTTCTRNSDCADFYCYTKDDGSKVCGRPCSPRGPACGDGLLCLTEGFACGACIPDPSSPQPYGAPCGAADECASGDCHAEGFCTQSCASHDDCPDRQCRAGRCEPGTPSPVGAACTTDEECATGAGCGPDGLCTPTCDAGCAASEVCADGLCMPDGLSLGEPCEVNEDCASRICAGTCTVLCTETGVCPEGFECIPAGTESGCFPTETSDGDHGGGGCAAGGSGPSGAALLLLVALLWRRRCG